MGAHRTTLILGLCLILASVLAYLASTGASRMIRAENDAGVAGSSVRGGDADGASMNNGVASPDPALRLGFVPHKAIYDIRLSGKKSGSQILNIAGQMFYEWDSNCEAWNSRHKFNLIYEYADTSPMQIASDFLLYERFDGTALDFTSQHKNGEDVIEEIRGFATLDDDGGQALYRVPDDLKFDLPAGALFPMRHSLAVLEQMKAGEKFYNAIVFDGSDKEGPTEINAFIGRAAQPANGLRQMDAVDQALLDAPARAVRLAFFPLNQSEADAEYEMSMVFHENGVISGMEIDYSDFSVSQTLVALEKKDKSTSCGDAP